MPYPPLFFFWTWKGDTDDWEWQLGSHAAIHNRQNLDHVFFAFHVLSHSIYHIVQKKEDWCDKFGETSHSHRLQETDR